MYINATANSVMLQICALLGFYEALNGSFLSTFRDNLSVSSSRVKYPLESNFNKYSLRVPPSANEKFWVRTRSNCQKWRTESHRIELRTVHETVKKKSSTQWRWNGETWFRAGINKAYEKNNAVWCLQEQGARGEFSHNKENKSPPAYCRVCSCNGRHFQVLLNWNLQGE